MRDKQVIGRESWEGVVNIQEVRDMEVNRDTGKDGRMDGWMGDKCPLIQQAARHLLPDVA